MSTSSTTNHGRAGRPWTRIRLQILTRDPYCQIRGTGCTGMSTTVDHVVPLSVRPDLAHVLSNLRGACRHCNCANGARLVNAQRQGRSYTPTSTPRSSRW